VFSLRVCGCEPAAEESAVNYKKTGAEDIADALIDFDELRATVSEHRTRA
jgi:hypothetical protein